jgi:hypothetical protein
MFITRRRANGGGLELRGFDASVNVIETQDVSNLVNSNLRIR